MPRLAKSILLTTVLALLMSGCVDEKAKEKKGGITDNSGSVTADNPEAILLPPEKLQPDTLEAANHDRTKSKIAYIGVWAADAKGCALVDAGVYDGFATITPGSIRQFEEICKINAGPLTSNIVVLDAKCSAEGETRNGTIRIEMQNSQSMMFSHGSAAPYQLIRCNLPR